MASDSRVLEIYLANRGTLLNQANRILADRAKAEDVVQEAWLRLKAASGGGVLDEPAAYLQRIVRNLAYDVLRRLSLERQWDGGDLGAQAGVIPDDRPSPEAELIARRQLELVRAAAAELPERTRIAMEMHRLGGCTLKEIAAHLDVSVTRAHGLVMEGIRHCREHLAKG
jgi:RNA polymerase sigma-70 factor (ECF subfamily)